MCIYLVVRGWSVRTHGDPRKKYIFENRSVKLVKLKQAFLFPDPSVTSLVSVRRKERSKVAEEEFLLHGESSVRTKACVF
jgi:hypothetical protein